MLKHITVSEENYQILRGLGDTSDSMNDVITVILNNVLQQQLSYHICNASFAFLFLLLKHSRYILMDWNEPSMKKVITA